MILGSLRILKIDEATHGGSAAIESTLPVNLSERMIAFPETSEASPPSSFSLDFGAGIVPSVFEIQGLIERSWADGFDPEGSKTFQPQGVRGNQRCIGT